MRGLRLARGACSSGRQMSVQAQGRSGFRSVGLCARCGPVRPSSAKHVARSDLAPDAATAVGASARSVSRIRGTAVVRRFVALDRRVHVAPRSGPSRASASAGCRPGVGTPLGLCGVSSNSRLGVASSSQAVGSANGSGIRHAGLFAGRWNQCYRCRTLHIPPESGITSCGDLVLRAAIRACPAASPHHPFRCPLTVILARIVADNAAQRAKDLRGCR